MNDFFQSKVWLIIVPIISAAAIFLIGYIVDKLVVKWLVKILEKTVLDPMLHNFILHSVRIAIWVVVLISVLDRFGIDSASIITVLAACGAAVALALQGSLSNLAGGILIMVSHPFKSGDYIIASGVEGTVCAIDLLHTTLLTLDNKAVTIPNANLTNGTVTNTTKSGYRRIETKVGIEYSSDIELARQTLLDLVKSEDKVLKKNPPACDVLDYADSSIVLFLRYWVRPADYDTVRFSVNNKIKPTLDKVGVGIAFPQLDVHLYKK